MYRSFELRITDEESKNIIENAGKLRSHLWHSLGFQRKVKIENEYKVEYKYIYSNIHDDNPVFGCKNDYIFISLNEDFDDILKTEDYKPATKELFGSLHNKYKEYRKMLDAINKEFKAEYKKFITE